MTDLHYDFSRYYGNFPYACCLCDGLEIIAKNRSFTTLPILGSIDTGVLLTRWLVSPSHIDELFTTGEYLLCISPCSSDISGTFHFLFRLFPCPFSPVHHLLTITDESSTYVLKDAFRISRHYDSSTQLLFPDSFRLRVSSIMDSIPSDTLSILYLLDFRFPPTLLDFRLIDQFILSLSSILSVRIEGDFILSRHHTFGLSLFFFSLPPEHDFSIFSATLRDICLDHLSSFSSSHSLTTDFQPSIHLGSAIFPTDAPDFDSLYSCALLSLNHSLFRTFSFFPHPCDISTTIPTDICFFTPSLHFSFSRRYRLLSDFPMALSDGDICAWFQPILRSTDSSLMSFESLVRWDHPDFGMIDAGEILSLSQSLGFLDSLTSRMVLCCAQESVFWHSSIKFAINVSPAQLSDNFVDWLLSLLSSCDFPASRLELEITEHSFIPDFSLCFDIIMRLRSFGISISLDDFGSGYTSLSHLRLLDFDKLKIDKSVCSGLPSDFRCVSIFSSILDLSRSMGISVIAEGIETRSQLDFFTDIDCGIQGFVYCPALSPSSLSSFREGLDSSGLDPSESESIYFPLVC